MATIEQLSAALVKADAAGNAADAKALADAIRQMRSAIPAAPQLPQSLRPRTAAPEEGIPGTRQESSVLRQIGQHLGNVAAGAVRGAGSIGATILRPFETAEENADRRRAMDAALESMGAQPESLTYGVGKIGAEIAGTAGVGGVLAAPVKLAARVAPSLAGVAAPVASALSSGGMAAPSVIGKIASGAVVGGAGAGLIDPDSATYGAAAGAAIPFVPGQIAKGVGKLADLRRIPKNKAADIARNALGPDLPEVLNALKASQGQGVSAAQATADINSPTWQALIDRATKRDPRFLSALEKSQGNVSLNALSHLAGGATAAEVRGTTAAAKEAARTITSPMRESALTRANLGKEVARLEGLSTELGEQAAAKVQEVRRLMELGDLANASARLSLIKRDLPVGLTKYTYGGELAEKAFNEWSNKAAQASLDLGQGARFAEQAAASLRSVGIKPLEGEPLVRSLKAVSNNPEFAGNDVLLGSLRNVSDDIAKWTSSGGIIDARALDAIRKNSVNAAIQQLRPGMDATSQRNLAAGVLSRVKPVIDDAIEAAGGAGYRDYLNEHTKLSQKIAEKQLVGEALKLWKTDKNAFVRLVQNESPEAVEKILGPGKYNIAVELAEDMLGTLQSEATKVIRNANVKSQTEGGQTALKELLLQNISKFRLPSYLNAVASTTNNALNILENKIGQKTMATLTEALKTPEGAANLLESLPAAERNRVLQLIGDPSKWSATARATVTGGTAAAVNMLAPDRNVENEFVR